MTGPPETSRRRLFRGNPQKCSLLVVAAGLPILFALAGCRDTTGPGLSASSDLLDRLNSLPGVEATEITPHYGYPRAFRLDITQPLNHENPFGPTFTQRAYLSHADDSTPMVFAPSGYGTSPSSGQELASILQTNCLSVTHRFFPDARPRSMDWRFLSIWQAAADHHRIVTLLKMIYGGKWISTGASKGGETVLFHRRFYPKDVDATVAYVAPLLFSDDDPRFLPYLRSRGTLEEREAIFAFQKRLIERKQELLPHFEDWFSVNGLTLSIPTAPTFESAVVSYEWGYWQRHLFDPSQIPGPLASAEELVNHLAEVVRLNFRSDEYRDYFSAYVYQARTEIGLPRFTADHLASLLTEEPVDVRVAYSFPPELSFDYHPEIIQDILQWVQSRGDEIILIYGSVDPWTAGAVELTGQTDAVRIVQEGADHQVRIAGLDLRDVVLDKLGSWLGMDLTRPAFLEIRAPQPQATFLDVDPRFLVPF
ncbi:S28 family serine protease [Gemmatimonadota bacterium]